MRINTYEFPKSSFLSMEKDMGIVAEMLLKNENLKKMLYYTTKDPLSQPRLTEEQSLELFGKNVKLVPKMQVDDKVLNYIIITFDDFTPNETNPEYRDNIIMFDVLCHFDQWQMKDFQLRPYKIAAEIDSMFNNKHLTGIGTLQFMGASQIMLNSELGGLCLMYAAIHGEEDKKKMPNPVDEESFQANFNELFNNK